MRSLIISVLIGALAPAAVLVGAPAAGAQAPVGSSEVSIINATDRSVDVYVNYEQQPTISDPKPLVGSSANKDELNSTMFTVDGSSARPYGVYTFAARPKGDPNGPVLGSASIELSEGASFSGVFHEAAGGYGFAIYENDLSPAAGARLTVRNTSPQAVSWRIAPNGEAPHIPPDERSGSLAPGQWQIARDVIDNDYVIEFFIGGQLVGRNPDLDLAAGENNIVYLIGRPEPATDPEVLLRPVVYEEREFAFGPVEPRVTTAPASPASTSDQNAPVQFQCGAVEVWETNAATTTVSAVDPDGVVTNLSIGGVTPAVGGVEIGGVVPSSGIGQPASAQLSFNSGIPDGSYDVAIVANQGSLAQHASCSLALTVKPITVARLRDRVSAFQASGDVEAGLAGTLDGLLADAQQRLDAGDTGAACADLQQVIGEISAEKGKAISDAAADALTAETNALRSDLGC